jgi:hypothetical protein
MVKVIIKTAPHFRHPRLFKQLKREANSKVKVDNEMLNEPMANHRLQEKCSRDRYPMKLPNQDSRNIPMEDHRSRCKCSPGADENSNGRPLFAWKTVCSETDCPIASKGQKSLSQGIIINPVTNCHGDTLLNP